MPTASPSILAQVGQSIVDRVATVKTVNGYPRTIRKVFYDQMPMGLELQPHEMPAILVIDEGARTNHDKLRLDIEQTFRLQLILERDEADEKIYEMIRSVIKAIYANSPNAERIDGFRALHEKIVEIKLLDYQTDLHMIESNRIATLRFSVHYRTKLFDL